MINQATIAGRLGRDPDIRQAGGSKVASLNIAVSESWKDANGKWQEKTHWLRASAWGKTAELAESMQKGDLVLVSGSIEVRSWSDKDGNKRESVEVRARTLLKTEAPRRQESSAQQKTQESFNPDLDDEIPF